MGILLSLCLLACALLSVKIIKLTGVTGISDATSLFISRIAIWLWLFILYVYVVKVEQQKMLLWQSKRNNTGFFIISFFAILFCVFAGAAIINKIEALYKLDDKSERLKLLLNVFKNNTPLLWFTVLTAAITEEVAFRGYLIPRLQILFKNNYMPVIVSSLLFGLAHFGFGNIAQMINTAFIGLVFAIYFSKYRNLKVLIVVHFVIDIVAIYSRLHFTK